MKADTHLVGELPRPVLTADCGSCRTHTPAGPTSKQTSPARLRRRVDPVNASGGSGGRQALVRSTFRPPSSESAGARKAQSVRPLLNRRRATASPPVALRSDGRTQCTLEAIEN